jgi:hypothetical protein
MDHEIKYPCGCQHVAGQIAIRPHLPHLRRSPVQTATSHNPFLGDERPSAAARCPGNSMTGDGAGANVEVLNAFVGSLAQRPGECRIPCARFAACPGGHRAGPDHMHVFTWRHCRMRFGSPSPGRPIHSMDGSELLRVPAASGARARKPEPAGRPVPHCVTPVPRLPRNGGPRANDVLRTPGARPSGRTHDRSQSRLAFGHPLPGDAWCERGETPNFCKITEKTCGSGKRE